jgi:hypothetical protein
MRQEQIEACDALAEMRQYVFMLQEITSGSIDPEEYKELKQIIKAFYVVTRYVYQTISDDEDAIDVET